MANQRNFCRLALVLAAIGVVWLGVLPRLCDQPGVAQHISNQQQLNIDPSALFYMSFSTLWLQFWAWIAELASKLAMFHTAGIWEKGGVQPAGIPRR